MANSYLARAFGLNWRSDTPLSLFADGNGGGRQADVTVERVTELPPRPHGQPFHNGEIFADGIRFSLSGSVFDMFDGRLVRWTGPVALPLAFYGTVTALLLAWRGQIPLHGSAVSLQGGTVLIAGRSGVGKSTLCHALVEGGGQLVSDDLSVLMPLKEGKVPHLQPGRPSIRLVHERTLIDPDDKMLVTPPAVAQDQPVALTHLILLQDAPIPPGPLGAAAALARQQFRPRWMRRLPDAATRTGHLFMAAQRITIHVLPPAPATPDVAPAQKAAEIAALLMDSAASGR